MQFPTALILSAFGITAVVAQVHDECTPSSATPIDSSIPVQAAAAWSDFFANGHQISDDELLCSDSEGCYSYHEEAFCYDSSTSSARFADGSFGNLHTNSFSAHDLKRQVASSSSSSSRATTSTLSTTVGLTTGSTTARVNSTSTVTSTTVRVNSTSTLSTSTSRASTTSSGTVLVTSTARTNTTVVTTSTPRPSTSTAASTSARTSSLVTNGMARLAPEAGSFVLGAAGLAAFML